MKRTILFLMLSMLVFTRFANAMEVTLKVGESVTLVNSGLFQGVMWPISPSRSVVTYRSKEDAGLACPAVDYNYYFFLLSIDKENDSTENIIVSMKYIGEHLLKMREYNKFLEIIYPDTFKRAANFKKWNK